MHTDDFSAAWDARDQLVNQLRREETLPQRALYLRADDGGVLGAGLLPGHGGLMLIQWHGSEFFTQRLVEPELKAEPVSQQADGFGGMFGLGEKSANGWMLHFLDRGALVAKAPLYPAITAFADLLPADDRFLYGKPKPRRIPLWQLKPERRDFCEYVVSLWVKLFSVEE